MESTRFTPLLPNTDWNDEWIKLQERRRHAGGMAYWDERSKTYRKNHIASGYTQRFLRYANLIAGENVFDMGCGEGNLAIPLARAGHHVIAADFSGGMLQNLKEQIQGNTWAENIDIHRMSWEDDWMAQGIFPKSADVAFASRSIATKDMRDSLEKLSDVARRHVCVTLATGSSPRSDRRILRDIGLETSVGRDFLYAFMIVSQMGYLPEVRYISSVRTDEFSSFDEAYETLSRMVDDVPEVEENPVRRTRALNDLRLWLTDNLVELPPSGERKRYTLRKPRVITWAFLAWDTNGVEG